MFEFNGEQYPCIATNVGGVGDMLKNDSDAILINNDISEMFFSLSKLSSDKLLRKRIGETALKNSSVFSSENMALKYFELYKKI